MTSFKLTSSPGAMVILRIDIVSKIISPIVIEVTLKDWVNPEGKIFPVDYTCTPAYAFLKTGSETTLTLTFKVPKELDETHVLYGSLSIPGPESYHFPIHLSIIEKEKKELEVFDYTETILIPPESKADEISDSQIVSDSIINLLKGLANLEILPAKWIVAELILECCKRGHRFAQTPTGHDFLARLSKTRFYKNGVLIFRGTQFPQWMHLSQAISSGIRNLTGTNTKSSVIHNWEEWLLNLINQDVESPEFEQHSLGLESANDSEQILKVLGFDPEKWFPYFILGLCQVSPRVNALLQSLIEPINLPVKEDDNSTKPSPINVIDEDGSLQR